MTDSLLVRFRQHDPASPQWLNTASNAEPHSGSWQELAAAAKSQSVVLLLPATAVVLLMIELPVKSNSQLKKALPFALEELLAEDVENYHLAWFRQPEGKVVVAAVSHEKLAEYLDYCRQAEIELTAVHAETLMLPVDGGACSVLIDGEDAIVRTGPWLGGGMDTDGLPLLLDKLLEQEPENSAIQLWTAANSGLPSLEGRQILRQPQLAPLKLYAQTYKSGTALNLLTEQYAPKAKGSNRWQQWLPALAMLLIAFAIQSGVLLNRYWQQQAEFQALEAQTLSLFKQTFPEVKRIVNAKAQADQQLAELKKNSGGTGSGFMRILYQTGELLKDQPGLHLQKLNFVNAVMQLQLNVSDIGSLEQFKQQLQNSLQVKILSADNKENAVEAQLEIREQ